jgi:uncharacterized paraquat-inducible protein A
MVVLQVMLERRIMETYEPIQQNANSDCLRCNDRMRTRRTLGAQIFSVVFFTYTQILYIPESSNATPVNKIVRQIME